MIEVFKTNVINQQQAICVVECVHKVFTNCKANFDLDDCDRILRVDCKNGTVYATEIINLLNTLGFDAEVLPDDCVQETELQHYFTNTRK